MEADQLETLENINIQVKNRVLKEPNFVPGVPDIVNLTDKVLVYNNGRNWKVVLINVMCVYPVVYDKFFEQDGSISDISVTFCPFTYAAVVYFGKYVLTDKIKNSNITLIKEEDQNKNTESLVLMSQMLGHKFVRKKEVRIMTLRNVISKYPDCNYLDSSKLDMKNLKRITDSKYTSSDEILYSVKHKSGKHHPKTLVYGIEYVSKDVNHKDYKYSVVVGAGDKSFDFVKSKYEEYFDKWIEKIREKGGILVPSFWFGWYAAHGGDKIVEVKL